MRGKGKFKPRRGGGHHFTSSRDPDAYVHNRPVQRDSDSEDSGSESGSSSNSGSESDSRSGSGSDSSFEVIVLLGNVINLDSDTETAKPVAPAKPAAKKAPRELTRREREAIEKEQARQHFLKMKEQEDRERLAVIRKRREEEAAQHAAEQKAKEEARFARR
ncbi:hypothetical protein PSACC_03110 [Paramicrosporidium saccamoebae]|uniref:Casein kinase substrate phosphoprotein PP28 domain-containing protein n=1 Tax=Paramicrosporidium saccamoebae TaxID=1246581 RepID=A0A2H9TH56_9FUNG|nr:hypothetical protein PSACC_03110 [Paramicrosporidium saccamoebae]